MKVRTQILLSLLVIAIAFVAGVGAIRYFERARFEELAERRAADWRRSMDDFLGRQRTSLITLAHYYSSLDGIVSAVADRDQGISQMLGRADAAGGAVEDDPDRLGRHRLDRWGRP